MENEILDDLLILKNEKRFPPKLLSWVSIIILWFGIGSSLILGTFTTKLVAAVILLSIATIINYINKEIGVKVMLGLIIAGIFGLIEFLPLTANIGYGTGQFSININLILVFIGMIHYITNKEYLIKYFAFFYSDKDPQDEMKQPNQSRINSFKIRFANKSVSELTVLSKNEKIIPQIYIIKRLIYPTFKFARI